MKRAWPVAVFLSALIVALVYFLLPGLPGRPLIFLWFLCVCPGMICIRFLQLKEPVTEWTLAIALSLALEAGIAGIQLYLGHWSPTLTLLLVIALCVVLALVQFIQLSVRKA